MIIIGVLGLLFLIILFVVLCTRGIIRRNGMENEVGMYSNFKDQDTAKSPYPINVSAINISPANLV